MPTPRATEQQCRDFLSSEGCQLESEFKGLRTRIKVSCKVCSGEFFNTLNALHQRKVQDKVLCPFCNDSARNMSHLDRLKKLGQKRVPPCDLADGQSYLGKRKFLDWSCRLHGRFSQTPENVQNGLWCPQCHPDADIT